MGLIVSNYVFSQNCIVKECDDMTDQCLYYPRFKMAVANDEKTIGFTMDAYSSEKTGSISLDGILVKSVNIGTCNEKDKLIIMLDDSTKVNLISWNDFNCEGNAWYHLKDSDINRLAGHKMIKAFFQNGRSYDSFSRTIDAEDQDYFMKLIADCRENKFTVKQK